MLMLSSWHFFNKFTLVVSKVGFSDRMPMLFTEYLFARINQLKSFAFSLLVVFAHAGPVLGQAGAGQQSGQGAGQGAEPERQPAHMFSIYFGGGSWEIDGQQITDLDQFINGIPNILQYDITIHSHTDNIGGADYNAWLSQMRSQATVYQLMQLSLPPEMMQIKDFGQYNPVYDNSTWMGRIKNRRVDIILWPIVL